MAEPRVQYINLMQRCGGQYGPNTAGLYLTETKFVAFLNHDDLWLPDHLARGLIALKKGKADFYLGLASFAETSEELTAEIGRPAFVETNFPGPLSRAFAGANYIFEPASSWILRTKFALRVGPWRPSYLLCRTSLQDWLLRAWRLNPKMAFGDKVTVLKLNLHHTPRVGFAGRHQYAVPQPLYAVILKLIKQLGAEGVRSLVEADLGLARDRNLHPRNPASLDVVRKAPPWLRRKAILRLLAQIYRVSGVDFVDKILKHPERAMMSFQALVRKRTGKDIVAVPGMLETLRSAKEQFESVHGN